jgi:prepilin-type N-terminal cleavage/methylation domain-containing protein
MKLKFTTNHTLALTAGSRGRRAAMRGFTLIEVMIAAVVSAITFGAAFYGISTGLTLLQSSREDLRATQIALSRVEALRLEQWGTNQLFNTAYVPTNFTDYFYSIGSITQSSNTVYAGTITFSAPALSSPTPSYIDNMRQVTVSVTWTNTTRTTVNIHTRTMVTYVARYGIQNYVYSSN